MEHEIPISRRFRREMQQGILLCVYDIFTTIGRITKDLELKKGEKSGCIYANFNLAVNEGFGGSQKTLYYECTVFGADAERLVKAKARKGSLLHVTGKFGVSDFTSNNGKPGYRLKITVLAWSYIPGANGNGQKDANSSNGSNDANGGGANAHVPEPNHEAHYQDEGFNGTTNLDDEDLPF